MALTIQPHRAISLPVSSTVAVYQASSDRFGTAMLAAQSDPLAGWNDRIAAECAWTYRRLCRAVEERQRLTQAGAQHDARRSEAVSVLRQANGSPREYCLAAGSQHAVVT